MLCAIHNQYLYMFYLFTCINNILIIHCVSSFFVFFGFIGRKSNKKRKNSKIESPNKKLVFYFLVLFMFSMNLIYSLHEFYVQKKKQKSSSIPIINVFMNSMCAIQCVCVLCRSELLKKKLLSQRNSLNLHRWQCLWNQIKVLIFHINGMKNELYDYSSIWRRQEIWHGRM